VIYKDGKPDVFLRSFVDITDRKIAEEKLHHNQAVLAHVLDSIPQSVFWKDKDCVFLGCNKLFAETFGFSSPNDLIGKTDFDLPGTKKLQEQYRSDDREVMDNKRAKRNIIEPVEQGGGKRIWVNTTKVPLLDKDNNVYGVLGIFEDITERKQAEEALQEKVKEIERFNSLATDREIRILELKREVNALAIEAGACEPYPSALITGKPDVKIDIAGDNEESQKEVKLTDILNIKQTYNLLDTFCKSFGVSMSIIDTEGKVIIAAGWSKICRQFHRLNKTTKIRCIESDTKLAAKVNRIKGYAFYRCQNGLNAAAAPIIINKKYVANIFIGQFFVAEPDLDFFYRQADQFGFEPDSYLEAVKQVPLIDEGKLPSILSFISKLAELVASMSYNSWRTQMAETALKNRADELNRRGMAALSLAEDAEQARREIAEYRDHLEDLVSQRTKDLEGARLAALSLMQDANRQRHKVEEALAEKEVLLREIHHRVKNNLNSISNLLYLQSKTITDKNSAAAFKESQNRIHSMARVHEHLYRSQNLARINMQSYLEEMAADLVQSQALTPTGIKVETSGVMLDVDRAIPFGLLVNELITNSLKHAFANSENSNEVIVKLQSDNENFEMEICDNGKGLPADLDISKVTSLGLRLVTMLTRQLQGTYKYESIQEQGTTFKVTFPIH
jgi:PAS domain S-box-containing protein